MNTTILIVFVGLFIFILAIAILRARKANNEESASKQHPGMFKKPDIERVEKQNEK